MAHFGLFSALGRWDGDVVLLAPQHVRYSARFNRTPLYTVRDLSDHVKMYPRIVVTGDSIAQLSFRAGGYGSALVDKYQGKLDVLNRGMGGYNSRQLLQKFQEDFVDGDIRLFVINIGTNDSAINALQTVPVDEYAANLRKIIQSIHQRHQNARIVLLTPSTLDPPICEKFEDTFQIPKPLRSPRYPDHTRKYVDTCIAVGEEMDVPVIDCFQLHEDALENVRLGDIFEDGLHFSAQGYSYINKALIEMISTFPELLVERMPNGFPDFWIYGVTDSANARWVAELFGEIRRRAEQHFALQAAREQTA